MDNKVDIIIPTYQNEQLTAACFRSIRASTNPSSYRIVWVDNGSGDPSIPQAELTGLNYTLIQLTSNRGFVGAVNEGLRASTGKMVCLLNNDTKVSYGWLEKLTAILSANGSLGIVGPLTIYHKGPGVDSHHSLSLHNSLLPPEAKGWDLGRINCELEQCYFGQTRPIAFVAFLCAVIKREVLDRVGLLDPNYAMGMYDDNDYNIAARRAGFSCELALDTCIYHRGRATFSILEKKGLNVSRLLAKNKAYLDRKWKNRK